MIDRDCHEKDSPNSRPGLSVDYWHGTDQRICVSSSAAFDGPLLRRQGGHSAFCSHSPFSWAGEAAGVGAPELKGALVSHQRRGAADCSEYRQGAGAIAEVIAAVGRSCLTVALLSLTGRTKSPNPAADVCFWG